MLVVHSRSESNVLVDGRQPSTPRSRLGSVETAYAQDFDTLAPLGSSSVLRHGGHIVEAGANAESSSYTASSGSQTLGDTYSYGEASYRAGTRDSVADAGRCTR